MPKLKPIDPTTPLDQLTDEQKTYRITIANGPCEVFFGYGPTKELAEATARIAMRRRGVTRRLPVTCTEKLGAFGYLEI